MKNAKAAQAVAEEPRRLGRRERQRLENPSRAAVMHEARIRNPIEQKGEPAEKGFYIGCSGWYYRDWKGCFYPESLPDKDWFPYYAGHFNTVELNAPFYSWPKVATVKSWIRQARDRSFIYTVKVNELITHSRRFVRTKALIKDFGYIADLLGPRMGCFLFQLPPGYHYSPARLKAIVGQLDPARRNVVEFRHASWWNGRVYDAFRDAGIVFCSCSAPKLPDQLIHTADDVYIRFHGKEKWYLHDYSKQELAVWTERVRESGARRVWAYFNNDRECRAPGDARDFLKQLSKQIK